ASGIACAVIGFFRVLSVAMGPASVIGFISIAPASIPYFMIGVVVSLVLSFGMTYVYGKNKMSEPLAEGVESNSSVVAVTETVHASAKEEVIGTAVSGE